MVETMAEEVETKKELCGHVNTHAGLDANKQPVVCSLEKGHAGLHRGKFTKLIVDRVYENKKLVSKTNRKVERETEWSDAAGKVATEFPPEITPPSMAELEFGEKIGKDIVAGLLQ